MSDYCFKVSGDAVPLTGSVTIDGSKNATLALMAASLLSSSNQLTLEHVPKLSDIHNMKQLLESLGSKITMTNNHMEINNSGVKEKATPTKEIRLSERNLLR